MCGHDTPRGGLWRSVAIVGACLLAALGVLPDEPARADEMPTFRLAIEAGRMRPETLQVPANTRFRLEVSNAGPGAAEFESQELRKELVLAPGVSRSVVIAPLPPGRYRFFDDFNPATGQGWMVAR